MKRFPQTLLVANTSDKVGVLEPFCCDIDLNDPKDSNTQEKLKTVLTKGAFNFNPKEREALEKILGS